MKFLGFALILTLVSPIVSADWKIDFSRRAGEIRKTEINQPKDTIKSDSLFDLVFESKEPVQELVILNTETGFVPSTLRLREGYRYKVNVVNINTKQKNISFVLDAFSEHHATYYGQLKSFYIQPKREGVYNFQCPETSVQGRLVVYPKPTKLRMPASQ